MAVSTAITSYGLRCHADWFNLLAPEFYI